MASRYCNDWYNVCLTNFITITFLMRPLLKPNEILRIFQKKLMPVIQTRHGWKKKWRNTLIIFLEWFVGTLFSQKRVIEGAVYRSIQRNVLSSWPAKKEYAEKRRLVSQYVLCRLFHFLFFFPLFLLDKMVVFVLTLCANVILVFIF